MPARINNKGSFARPLSDLSAKALLPGLTPDTARPHPADASLSAAFRTALGGRPGEAHLRSASPFSGKEIAKQAKADKPGALPKGPPRKAHIGPRSGHK